MSAEWRRWGWGGSAVLFDGRGTMRGTIGMSVLAAIEYLVLRPWRPHANAADSHAHRYVELADAFDVSVGAVERRPGAVDDGWIGYHPTYCPHLAGAVACDGTCRQAQRCVHCGTPSDPAWWPECRSCQRGAQIARRQAGGAWLAEHRRQLRARDARRRAGRNDDAKEA